MVRITRHKAVVFGSVALLAALVFLLCLALRSDEKRTWVSVGFTPCQFDRFAPWADHSWVAFVTNRTGIPVRLYGGVLQWSCPDGSVVSNNGLLSESRQCYFTGDLPLPPDMLTGLFLRGCHERSELPDHIPMQAGRREPWPSAAQFIRAKVPPRLLPRVLTKWLREHGWLDGFNM